jgi:uncharacterized membrane protein YoaK (UPF0700 family)
MSEPEPHATRAALRDRGALNAGALRRGIATTLGRRHLALVLLAVNSGATDAIGVVSLGGAFTSVMTGNMVLLGLSATRGDGSLTLRSGLALLMFATGAFAGARIARAPRAGDPIWPRPVVTALCVQLAGEGLFAIGWEAARGHPVGALQPVLLGISAINLGIQSSAIMRFGVSGLSTTYLTGTLTVLVATLARGEHPRNVVPSAQLLCGLIGGAALAAALAKHAAVVVPALQLIPVGYAVVASMSRRNCATRTATNG